MHRVLLVLLLAACEGPLVAADASVSDAGPRVPRTLGPEERPARIVVPPAHDGTTPLPLLVLLHGYTVTSVLEDGYLGGTRTARDEGFYLLLPDGTRDAESRPHWDVLGRMVDDAGYLRALIEEAQARLPVDPGAIFVLGHSNGGFMAYRLACESGDLVSGIASLAGSDAIAGCAPARPVSVLQIHGTADDTVLYEGGSIAGLDYPSALVTVERWAERAGCDVDGSETLAPRDLITSIEGAETEARAYRRGCSAPAATELWSMGGGDHIPSVASDFTSQVMAWLRDHAR